MAKRLSADIECFWSSDELDDDVLAIDFLFDKYPKAHWVDEIELPDNVSGVVYTQCDDDDNIGRVTVSYIDEFVNSEHTDKINVNGYNLKKLVLDAYKLLRKQDNYKDEDINFDFSEYYNRVNK